MVHTLQRFIAHVLAYYWSSLRIIGLLLARAIHWRYQFQDSVKKLADTILVSEISNSKGKLGTNKRVFFGPIPKILSSHQV